MGQDNAERYLQKKYEMENAISANEKRVFETGDNDERRFLNLDNLDDFDLSSAMQRRVATHLKYERGAIWIDKDGKIYTRCPVCRSILTVSSVKNHLYHQHGKTFAHSSNRLEEYNPRDSNVEENEEREEKSEAVDVFDKMRRLKEDYPRLFESLTGEQLKLILEDD